MLYTVYVIVGYLFYLLSISVHVLVLNKKISFKLINGGRSETFESQAKTSRMSIVILCIGILILVVFHAFPNISKSLPGVIIMGILTVYWTLGFVMQLLGTSFERKYMTPVLMLGILSHLMLFLSYFFVN